ncbi:hypothetical protein [Mycobacterium marinum]|uniref:hypothetical protein n=1 Tax=Mycobacterium marinum TaxID=1781 RepID=UPI001920E190|nr:hypothetical protein [Mycobacterium marinum]QQW36553.1 hypothetical protein HXW97_24060 [Mycobacterium marinum]
MTVLSVPNRKARADRTPRYHHLISPAAARVAVKPGNGVVRQDISAFPAVNPRTCTGPDVGELDQPTTACGSDVSDQPRAPIPLSLSGTGRVGRPGTEAAAAATHRLPVWPTTPAPTTTEFDRIRVAAAGGADTDGDCQ